MEKLSEMKYVRPDVAALKKQMKLLAKEMISTDDYEKGKATYGKFQKSFDSAADMVVLAQVRNTMDLRDKFYDEEIKYLNKEISKLSLTMKKVGENLLKCSWRGKFEEEFGTTITKDMEIQIKLFNFKVLFLSIKEGKLEQEFKKVVGTCTTDFRGEKCNFYGLLKHMQSTDRATRKEAFDKWAEMYERVSPTLNDLYDKLVKVRVTTAKRLGFDSYIDYIYLQRRKGNYGPKDVESFRESVLKNVVPVVAKMHEERAKRLGLDKLECYDESLYFADGNPVPVGTTEELIAKANKMYHSLSPETGEFFDFMTKYELFDLETKEGKHMGGYCTYFMSLMAPFIFSNFNGTSADVDVLTHEAGHAFQAYVAFRCLQYSSLVNGPYEVAEIHSMTMEHFAYNWMDLFFEDADKYKKMHLDESLACIPYLVCVDEFQHRVFEKPEMNAVERSACWREIEKKYMPWRSYDGNEFLEKGGYWMQKQHIFLYPFYYIDYALAQTCAYQLYIRSKKDFAEAWQDYLNLCKAGGSKPYFDLLKVARIDSPFEESTLQKVVKELFD